MSRFTGYLNESCTAALAVPNLRCNVSVYIRKEGGERGGRRGGGKLADRKLALSVNI
jgi:hypothetical protein